VDGSASNDASNLIEEVRQALLLQRLVNGAATVSHVDALRWATEGGARCLGRDDIGRIAPGVEADLALFRLDDLRHSGGHDPLAALVVCGIGRADRVMVGGTWRVEEGHAVDIDEPNLMRRHNQAAGRLRQLAGLEG
jgi:8-oxoguanine deaminase